MEVGSGKYMEHNIVMEEPEEHTEQEEHKLEMSVQEKHVQQFAQQPSAWPDDDDGPNPTCPGHRRLGLYRVRMGRPRIGSQ